MNITFIKKSHKSTGKRQDRTVSVEPEIITREILMTVS